MARRIYVTESDLKKLGKLLIDQEDNARDEEHIRDLEQELMRAQVMSEQTLPADVITMNTRVLLRLDGAEEEEVTVVYPQEADALSGRISVLSPIGTAILGYREGDTIEWCVPSGTTRVEVVKVLFQPEAAQKAVHQRADGR